MAARKVDINSATQQELMESAHIDFELADAIVRERTYNGGYKNVDELDRVLTTDDATLARLKSVTYAPEPHEGWRFGITTLP